MDYYSKDSPKYPDTTVNQPGLEVNYNPTPAPRAAVDTAFDDGEKHEPGEGAPRKILGLSVGIFWAVVLVIALLIAGGIGGGVGAGLAGQKDCAESSNATIPTRTITITSTPGIALPTSSTTTSATRQPSVSPIPTSPCTNSRSSVNGTTFTPVAPNGDPFTLSTGGSQSFRIFCNTNWPGGAAYGNPGIHDIMKLYMPTLADCMAACAAYNDGYVRGQSSGIDVGGGLCRAIALVVQQGEYCYLKNGTGLNDTSTSGQGVQIDSAALLI